MHNALADCFSGEYARRFDELRSADTTTLGAYRAERDKLTKERRNILAAIRNGISVSLIKDELDQITCRLNEIDEHLVREDTDAPPYPHTTPEERYWAVVDNLIETLNCADRRTEFAAHLGGLIDKVVLTPADNSGDLQTALRGVLASILAIRGENNQSQHDWLQIPVVENTSAPSAKLSNRAARTNG